MKLLTWNKVRLPFFIATTSTILVFISDVIEGNSIGLLENIKLFAAGLICFFLFLFVLHYINRN